MCCVASMRLIPETIYHLSGGYLLYASNVSPNVSQNVKRNINRKLLREKKNAFHYCRHRSGRHYGKSPITLRLKCGLGKSSFQESFSWNSSATPLISTRVGTPQRAKWRGRAQRGRGLNWERALPRPPGNFRLMERYGN